MKAKVKATGEIVEIIDIDFDTLFCNNGGHYTLKQIEGIECDPDYWTRLEHQAAISAMGGICGNASYDESSWADMAQDAIRAAHALIQKLKEKEERK